MFAAAGNNSASVSENRCIEMTEKGKLWMNGDMDNAMEFGIRAFCAEVERRLVDAHYSISIAEVYKELIRELIHTDSTKTGV